MKLYLKLFLCIGALLTITGASAQGRIDIQINGEYIKTDVDPYVKNNRTLVPVRFVAEALAAESVSWDGSSQKVYISGENDITLTIGSNKAYVNGSQHILDTAPEITADRTFLPARFIAENLGASVDWSDEQQTVLISKNGLSVDKNLIDYSYTPDELYWMSRIIHAEAQGESFEGKVAVGNVILNRVKSDIYPDSIYGVIFDRKHGVQYEPVLNGTIYNTPSAESVKAAKTALLGTNYIGECLFFFNPRIAQSNWISKNRVYYSTIGNHDFYL